VEYANADIDKAIGAQVGQECECRFYLRGRKWEKDGVIRYYPSIKGVDYAILAGGKAPADDSDNELSF
jgi:hypothetical protein